MGDLLRWGVFSLGGDITLDDTAGETSGRTYIQDDVGIAESLPSMAISIIEAMARSR
jgi:hypothetical protein